MKTSHMMAAAVLAVASAWAPQLVQAQSQAAQVQMQGIQRTDLIKNDIVAPGREVVQTRVDIPPGVASPKHSHPGEEVAYVLEGTLKYELEGRAPVTLKAGEALFIPAGVAHVATNVGDVTASELATYILKKGKPLAVQVK